MKAKRKTTIRQKRATDNIMSGEFETEKDALVDAGYSESIAEKPYIVKNSEGVAQYLQTFDAKAQVKFGVSLRSKVQDVLLDGLQATKLYGKDAISHPDYNSRLSYTKVISEMLGILESKDKGGKTQVNFFMFDDKQRKNFNNVFNSFVRAKGL